MNAPGALAERLRRALADEQDARLLARATELGLIDPGELARARAAREESGDPRGLCALLVERGALDGTALARLELELAEEAFARPAGHLPPPPDVAAALGDPERVVDEFVLVERIGGGGSGEVWRAWDRALGRRVAVKISTAPIADAAARERFAREALATAQLDDPHIVPVFRVGAFRGRPFLVMPFVDGETLDRIVARDGPLPLDRALEVLIVAADAVAHAHARGIFHRDVKPGNVIVDGAGAVHMLDFGLAFLRAEESSRLTRPGEILGTASFMAPEQARGDEASARETVDVYGLGATLYFVLTGRAPFVGATFAAVVAQVIAGDPTPPRSIRPQLPPAVEAVILTALDREPARRYPSAAAFAAELRRLRDGERVTAARSSRLRRWVRRHPSTVVGAAAVALAATLALAVTLGARRQAASESATAARALLDVARVSLDTALRLRRAGDVAGMRQVLPRVSAAYAEVAARGAETAEVEYLMGRTHRALLDPDRALIHQERALARDPAFAPALYERAVLLSRLYGRALETARAASAGEPSTTIPGEAVLEANDPALGRLRARIVADAERLRATDLGGASALAARGILAYHRGRHDEARAALEQALARAPDMEEAWETLAQSERAANRRDHALAAYARGIARDRGYVPFLVGRCELLFWPDADAAIADADRALALDPAADDARACRAGVLMTRAHRLLNLGRDVSADLDAAEADFSRMLAARDSAAVRARRATARRYRGILLVLRGEDPRAAYAGSEADASRAMALAPLEAEHAASRGRTRTWRARWAWQEGLDPSRDLADALADLDRAERLGATQPVGLWRGDLRGLRAAVADVAGRGPIDPELGAAEADFTFESRNANAGNGWLSLLRGETRTYAGLARARTGADPEPAWARAEEDLALARQRLADYVEPLVASAALSIARAAHLAQRGGRRIPPSGRAEVRAAIARLDLALQRAPRFFDALWLRARARSLAGDTRGATADQRAALAIRPARARWVDAPRTPWP